VIELVERQEHFAGRERDEKEVLGYYAALAKMEQMAAAKEPISESQIQLLHALVMAGGRRNVKPTPYRDGQNVIRDSRSKRIVYLPPEAKDVPLLMGALVAWLRASQAEGLPAPILAGIAHYQFATVHPYYDGNGRTARLLTTLLLHLGGYDLKGIYSLEEYYAKNLAAYYAAMTIGPSHNYDLGREESDITGWVDYFCAGAAESFETVRKRAQEASAAGAHDFSSPLRRLDPRQRRVLELFREHDKIASRDVEKLFNVSQRWARKLLNNWVTDGFIIVADSGTKSRKYGLAEEFRPLLGGK